MSAPLAVSQERGQNSIRRALAIVNPRSGGQFEPPVATWLAEAAQMHNIALSIRETSLEQDARDLVQDANQFDRVIAAGGDGTLVTLPSDGQAG
jgi:diacylglycerol kinase family enzyme